MMYLPKAEHPRPDFYRDTWQNLNGAWEFQFDDEDVGLAQAWYQKASFSQTITVPFCYESAASGIHDTGYHPVCWYRRRVTPQLHWQGKRLFLNFCAVDYQCDVWVNGRHMGSHEGGYAPFGMDITECDCSDSFVVTVRCEDRRDCTQPRGKQYWKEPEGCFYTPVSGIWQTVWLEAKNQLHLESVQITPDIDERCIHLETSLAGCFTESLHLDCQVSLNGRQVAHAVFSLPKSQTRQTLCFPEESALDNLHYWTPESPVLYDIQLTLLQDALALDTVSSYFGMRKIEVRDTMILLNNNVLFQRLCLDQGYWEDTLLTAPDDEALRQDILLAKQAGFNGVRSHQKIEEARFYYWADKLGFLVWGELPSAYEFCTKEEENLHRDLTAMIRRDYNHPSIITWVPLNESWGVRNILTDRRQQDFASSLYYLCKALDPSRLVSTNDGWEMVASCDFYGVHDYAPYAKDLTENYASLTRLMASRASSRLLYAQGQPSCTEKPVLITEYGGISFTDPNHPENWGYNGLVQNEEEFLARYADITRGFCALPYCWGYCYTQLTDVFQEANGLLRMDRTWKVDPQRLREINLSCGAK